MFLSSKKQTLQSKWWSGSTTHGAKYILNVIFFKKKKKKVLRYKDQLPQDTTSPAATSKVALNYTFFFWPSEPVWPTVTCDGWATTA